MKLGEIIRAYRQRNRISMGDFAKSSGLSKPYISMLEADKNSNGGKPIKPSIETLLKVSCAVGMTLDELLRKLGDEEIDLRQSAFSEEETELLDGYRGLNDEGRRALLIMLNSLRVTHSATCAIGQRRKTSSIMQNNRNGNNYFGVAGGNFNSNVTAV